MTLRLFYALWPDDDTRAALMRLQAHVAGRKTRYENLHLTLTFLGQQPAARLPELKDILAALPAACPSLCLDRIGYFTQARIAWAGMHAVPDDLTALQDNLVEQLAQNNIVLGSRAEFRPHVTLARDATPPEELEFDSVTWQADKVALVESLTDRDGVIYRVLAMHPLLV